MLLYHLGLTLKEDYTENLHFEGSTRAEKQV